MFNNSSHNKDRPDTETEVVIYITVSVNVLFMCGSRRVEAQHA